ncbi:hypothetical protein [Brevundimonas vesicularis]|uniref:hypothetical protein n=1 Tax=Brevundimonas vesicularis TaxID=41276 RepID=UPI0022AC1252|nr:hypothetical protein [Brevundimonas vesicularis]
MGQLSKEVRDHIARAVERAKAVLQPGDKIGLTICGGGRAYYRMVGWGGLNGAYIESRTSDELSPYNIVALNGVPTSFRDDPEEHLRATKR